MTTARAAAEVGPAISLAGVTKAFGPARALIDVDLEVEGGSYVALMGPNGSGKTTLLRIVAGLSAPSRGSVRVAGADMRKAGPGVRALIGYVGHESGLYPDLTARENLMFAARLFGLREPADVVQRTADLLAVSRLLDRKAGTLSRGMRQRVSLVRALLHQPKVLLLDEPYTGLDEAAATGFGDLLEQLHGPDRVIVASTHDVSRAISGPDRMVALARGRIALDVPLGPAAADVAETYLSLLREEVAR